MWPWYDRAWGLDFAVAVHLGNTLGDIIIWTPLRHPPIMWQHLHSTVIAG